MHPMSHASRGQPNRSGERAERGFPEGKWSTGPMMSCYLLSWQRLAGLLTLGEFNGDNGWFCSSDTVINAEIVISVLLQMPR